MSPGAAFPRFEAPLRERAARIRLLALDVDGVMSDGQLYFSAEGDEIKAFNILDGHGIKQLLASDIAVAVITGRDSPLTHRRMTSLGIRHLIQGREDKRAALEKLMGQLKLSRDSVAYMGDDLPDLPALQLAGLGITVPNAHWFVRSKADYCTYTRGGAGAVREVTDLILEAQDRLEALLSPYTLDGEVR